MFVAGFEPTLHSLYTVPASGNSPLTLCRLAAGFGIDRSRRRLSAHVGNTAVPGARRPAANPARRYRRTVLGSSPSWAASRFAGHALVPPVQHFLDFERRDLAIHLPSWPGGSAQD